MLALATDAAAPGRPAALWTLADHWSGTPGVLDTVLTAATDTDPAVRRAAFRALVVRYPERAWPLVRDGATADPSDEERASLVRLVALVWPAEAGAEGILADRAVEDPAESVRAAAAHGRELLRTGTEPLATAVPPPGRVPDGRRGRISP